MFPTDVSAIFHYCNIYTTDYLQCSQKIKDYCIAFDKYDCPAIIYDRVSLQNWTKLQTDAADTQNGFIP